MLSPEAIQAIESKDDQMEVKRALVTLTLTGVIQNQIRQEKEALLSGNSDEPLETLAHSLLEYRRKTQQLQLLHDLGQTYLKEITHESFTSS